VSVVVRAARARGAARLVCEAWEIGVGTAAARRHLMDGIREMIGAVLSGGVRDLGTAMRPKDRRTDVLTVDTPYHARVVERLGRVGGMITATDDAIVPRAEWASSTWMLRYVRPSGYDHFLGSHRRLDDGTIEGVGFMRAAGDRPFDEEDQETLHLVHVGIGRLFEPPSPRDELPPRTRQTFDALLTGASEKEIAFRLGVSAHTVHEYIKRIYRAYGVRSRGELFARLAGR
jgi:DNA-binding CsgD family transcriptional regulator